MGSATATHRLLFELTQPATCVGIQSIHTALCKLFCTIRTLCNYFPDNVFFQFVLGQKAVYGPL